MVMVNYMMCEKDYHKHFIFKIQKMTNPAADISNDAL